MRLTIILLTAAFLNVSASGVSQSVTFSGKNVRLQEVFSAVRAQTGYVFFFDNDLLNTARPVTIDVKNMPLKEVLDLGLKGQPITYSIKNKTVIIKRATPEVINIVSEELFLPITGRVKGPDGAPLNGINVVIKGTRKGTVTDADGRFFLNANTSDVLIFSGIGFQNREVKIGTGSTIDISLQVKNSTLDTSTVMVNTGYQTVQKERMTGATVTVSSTELEKRYTPNILNNLEGRVAGLVNYRGTPAVRGVGTINASRDILVVVDGLPIDGSIANINPYDVESITVLKDAAAAAIYGVRATNGIIVVTTKKAKGRGTSVEFSSDVTITEKPNISYKQLTPAQQVDLESSYYSWYLNGGNAATPAAKTAAINATATSITNGNAITPVQYAWYQYAKNPLTYTKGQLDSQLDAYKLNDFRQQFTDNVLLNPLLQQYNLAIRTNGNNFQSSLILNYKTDNGGIINAYNRQLNIFYKGTYQVNKFLDVNFGVNGILGRVKESNSNPGTGNDFTIGTNVSPYLRLLDASGNRVYYATNDYNMYNTTTATMPRYSMLVNHLDQLDMDTRNTKQQNTRYFVNLVARIIPGLTFNPQFQYENSTNNVSAYSESNSYIMRYLNNSFSTPSSTVPSGYTSLLPENGGKLASINSSGDSWTARGQLNYRKEFGKHTIDMIAGTEFRQNLTKGTRGLLLGYDDQLQSNSNASVNYPALFAFGNSTSFKLGTSTMGLFNTYLNTPIGVITETRRRYNSNYANATYTYDNKYNVFGSYRIDYADVFGLDPKFRGKPLWSTGLSWNVSNEDFMSSVKWVDFLKLRASYGVTGNIPTGLSSTLVANSTLTNAVTNLPVSVVTSAANPELRWEKSSTTNLGLDFVLFNNRLTGSIDLYRKKGTDIFFTKRIDPSEGFTSQVINNGALMNKGIELSLDYSWLRATKRNGVSWSSLLVLSHNKNRITDIDEISVTPVSLVQNGYKIGYPVNSLYSFQYKGLNGVGQPQWLKADGTLTTTALAGSDINAVVYSGGTDPRINIALTNEVYYRGFSLNVLAVYYGGQYFRSTIPEAYSNGAAYGGMPSYLLNSWTPGKTNTLVPGFGQYSPGNYPGSSVYPGNHLPYSDAFVTAGDFIKIRNVVLGYQLPQHIVKKLGTKNVKLRFQLNNPKAVWTKNSIYTDPETINPLTGVGGARVPTSYVFGINFNL